MTETNEEFVEETLEETNQTPPEIDSKYRMIILAAQRSKQLQRGANPRVDADPRKTKSTRIALREIDEKKVNFEILN
ncbi:MAG TPA: DNA-directed RNA polymerase subunit omega [Pyrinomonadaceae bacterium]|nr:DNA-directed RNA polymerase subunit omega [Pyrinomonadaceae bacterium]